ncbi:MAG TPA: hypothetical protein VK203_00720 [Nostocaceae cyanobacterium]|nr:hypothetical protein [Nostocaceae cyanobacterium]
MDCKTATLVYQAENHLEKIKEIFPEAWQFLEEQAFAYVQGKADRFDADVKALVGDSNFKFRIVHREDNQLTQDLADLIGDITSRLLLEKHFSEVVGQPIYFSSICCKSHITADHEMTLEEVLPLQRAAVKLQ